MNGVIKQHFVNGYTLFNFNPAVSGKIREQQKSIKATIRSLLSGHQAVQFTSKGKISKKLVYFPYPAAGAEKNRLARWSNGAPVGHKSVADERDFREVVQEVYLLCCGSDVYYKTI